MSALPVSPIVPTSSGPAAQAGVVQMNLGATTGQIVTGAEFGLATTMGDYNHTYLPYADPAFQAVADQYPTDLLRHNWELNSMMDILYPSRGAAPNFAYIDNYLKQQGNLTGFFNNNTGTQVVTLGFPSWLNIASPSDQQLYGSMVKAIAQHFIAMGEPIADYELVNEPDGVYTATDMANTFNVVAQALKSVDPSYKLGGLTETYPRMDDLQTFFNIAGPNIGFVSYHQYVTNGSDGKSDQQVVSDSLTASIAGPQQVRALMQASGIPNSVPIFLGEYNVDGANFDDPNNGNMVGAVAAAAVTYGLIASDSNATMGALWCVINGSAYSAFGGVGNYYADPVAVVLSDLTQYMPGNIVQTTMPSNTPGLVGYTTEYGQGFSTALIDTNLSVGYTVDLSHDGLPTTGLFRVEVSNAHPGGIKTAITDLAHVSVAAGSVVIITDEAPHGGVEFTGGTTTGGTGTGGTGTGTGGTGTGGTGTGGTGTGTGTGGTGSTAPLLITPGTGSFTDAAGNVYTLDASGNAIENGSPIVGGSGTGAMELAGGVVYYQDATSKNWYTQVQGTFTQSAAPPAVTGGSTGGGTTPPPPPPPPTPSPDGTKITTAAASPIIDQAGNKWTLVQSASNGLQIAVNGTVDATSANVALLETLGGKIVQENTAGNWYSEPGPTGPWSQITNPTPPPPPPPPTPSPDGTKITTAAASPIIDQAGNKWTLVQSASNGLQIAVNGTVDATSANVALLETLGGKIVQENTAGNWYSEPGPTGPWSQITNPTPPPPINPAPVTTGTGSDSLVLSISEDAYQGNAQFTVSVDGNQLAGIFAATASHAAGASQNFTFKGDWAPGAHAVAVNFLNDAYGGTAATDRNLYVNGITYDGTATGQSAALMGKGPKSFSVTDTTAIPSPAVGSGSDTLTLNVSEDAYLGNAQFTVSVDGKQLGGTLTATALRASGANQNFTFKGDFGSGQHAVAVNFLNDAYGGPGADRNLYVNGITYNGTATGQSGSLLGTGPMTFAVSGGTTPSVSETGDHGSLTKNLSQTGSYTVGGDTFVLTSGNAASVTLGTGTSQIKFIGASSATLTGGSGQATVTADTGTNKFVAGAGTLDVTGGGGKDAYVFHASSGLLKLEDFSLAKGDTLTVDKALQGSLTQASDGKGGTMLTFGTGATHGVDIHGLAVMPTTSVLWA